MNSGPAQMIALSPMKLGNRGLNTVSYVTHYTITLIRQQGVVSMVMIAIAFVYMKVNIFQRT